jgi:hypothetical protein
MDVNHILGLLYNLKTYLKNHNSVKI